MVLSVKTIKPLQQRLKWFFWLEGSDDEILAVSVLL